MNKSSPLSIYEGRTEYVGSSQTKPAHQTCINPQLKLVPDKCSFYYCWDDENYDTQLFEVITLLFNKLLKTDHEPRCSITAMDKATLLFMAAGLCM